MKQPPLNLYLSVALCFAVHFSELHVSPAKASEPVDIGTRLELFVDDYLVETLSGGAEKRLHRPEPRETVLTLKKPWEGQFAYFTVLEDDGLVRLYYSARPPRQLTSQMACVAESIDGIHFTRPKLDLFPYLGETPTNIVWGRGTPGHHFTPFLDTNPEAPPEQRYKGVARHPAGGGLGVFLSPDGIHWEADEEARIVTTGPSDTQNLAFWDPVRKIYVAYIREFEEIDGRRFRTIRRAESPDFFNWTETGPVEYSDDRAEQMYTNGIFPYPRAPHIYLGFPKRFVTGVRKLDNHPHPGIGDAILMSSRDGKLFDRWEEAFIIGSPEPESWGDRNQYPAWGMIQASPSEIAFYWTDHNRYETKRVRRGILRTDGFVSVRAGGEEGELLTRPFVFSGDRLVVNYATSAPGGIAFELTDEEGEPIPGFSFDDGSRLFGNEIRQVVFWGTNADVGELAGRPVRLRVRLHLADLYSIQFPTASGLLEELETLLEQAARISEAEPTGFAARRTGPIQEQAERLTRRLQSSGAKPSQQALITAARLEMALWRYSEIETALKLAQEALEAADAMPEAGTPLAKMYGVPVVLARERLSDALADEEISLMAMSGLIERLNGAREDLDQAVELEPMARSFVDAADDLTESTVEGFGVAYQGSIRQAADQLETVLHHSDSTMATVRAALFQLTQRMDKFLDVETFPPMEITEVESLPWSQTVTGEEAWGEGLLQHLAATERGMELKPLFALEFDSEAGDYALFPANEALKADQITLEAWVWIDADYLRWTPVVLLGRQPSDDEGHRHAYNLWIQSRRPEFSFGGEEGYQFRLRRGPTLSPESWHHLAGTFDGETARLYVDGELAREESWDGEIDYAWSDVVQIGGALGGDRNHEFDGRIRDVRIWRRALEGSELRESMHRVLDGNEADLAGGWIYGPGAGDADRIFNLASAEEHGALKGARWFYPRAYRLSNPVRLPAGLNPEALTLSWQGEFEEADALQVLVGVTEGPDVLPSDWSPAPNNEAVSVEWPGENLDTYVWVKIVMAPETPACRMVLEKLEISVR